MEREIMNRCVQEPQTFLYHFSDNEQEKYTRKFKFQTGN